LSTGWLLGEGYHRVIARHWLRVVDAKKLREAAMTNVVDTRFALNG
jgi:hypothetical protein